MCQVALDFVFGILSATWFLLYVLSIWITRSQKLNHRPLCKYLDFQNTIGYYCLQRTCRSQLFCGRKIDEARWKYSSMCCLRLVEHWLRPGRTRWWFQRSSQRPDCLQRLVIVLRAHIKLRCRIFCTRSPKCCCSSGKPLRCMQKQRADQCSNTMFLGCRFSIRMWWCCTHWKQIHRKRRVAGISNMLWPSSLIVFLIWDFLMKINYFIFS